MSSGHSSSLESPATQRRVSNPLMQTDDATMGRFDDNDQSPLPHAAESSSMATTGKKTKQTPPPSPRSSGGGTVFHPLDIAATVDVGRPIAMEDDDDQKEESIAIEMSMEIDQEHHDDVQDDDDIDADLERLLGDIDTETSSTTNHSTRSSVRSRRAIVFPYCCCRSSYRIGNTTVMCPTLFKKTGLGLVGPHWFGPLCTGALLLAGSHFLINRAKNIGPISFAICIAFTVAAMCGLFCVSCKDPGIVTDKQPPLENVDLTEWRWCDFCNVHQPPDGAHCPDCNVCVEGYDHHCVWMGTCIGRRNFRAFTFFNLTWLIYLIYAVIWVTIIGPGLYGKKE